MILKIPAGAKIFLGAPARPMDSALLSSVAQVVAAIPDVLEAHIPQCYVPGITDTATQVLVIVLASPKALEPAVKEVALRVGRLLAPGGRLDIWPLLPDSSILGAVRNAGCRIFDHVPD
jgi:hypothetical protein